MIFLPSSFQELRGVQPLRCAWFCPGSGQPISLKRNVQPGAFSQIAFSDLSARALPGVLPGLRAVQPGAFSPEGK